MKKNKILSLAMGLLLSCSTSVVFAQAYKNLPLSPEAEQDAKTVIEAFKANPDGLADAVAPILKKYKKDQKTLIAIGNYFYKQKQYSPAISMSQAVYEKSDGSSLDAILLEGDCYFALQRYGEAAQKYEEATSLDDKDKYAYFRKVDVYKYINPGYSLDIMKTVKEKYPNDPAIDKTMASIYYHLNDTAKAGATYKTYFEKVKPVDDVDAATEYAIVRFLNKDYDGSLDIVNQILPKDPDEISLNRMKFYDLMELEKYPEANEAAKSFFGKFTDSLYNYNDYKYMASLQTELHNSDEAAKALDKAVKLTPEDKGTLFKDYSNQYKKAHRYDEAVKAYKTYIDKVKPGSIVEELAMGRIYFTAAIDTATTAEQKTHYIAEGTKLFDDVASKSDSYLGPYWGGKINYVINPNEPIEAAKNHYAEALKRLEGKGDDYNDIRVECLRYLAFYTFKKDDYANCRSYINQALALNPNDGLCKQINGVLKQLKK
jgi:tetratricopeptide (TPR) repeat protein